MASPHTPFAALGSLAWADVPQHGPSLSRFLGDIVAGAQVVIDSLPGPAAKELLTARAHALTEGTTPLPAPAAADQIRGEWKEVKVSPRDNPLAISVYKLAARDGQGAWFARRSVHDRLTFEQWKAGLESEFPETMKIQGPPGSGSIRGIGADQRVEHHTVPGVGQASGLSLSWRTRSLPNVVLAVRSSDAAPVFQLSAQFPGPTTPRDFVTLLLTSEASYAAPDDAKPLRQFMLVSKPCCHPDCPPRSGIIRAQYESVEVVREIPGESLTSKRSLSYADLLSDEGRRPTALASLYETPRAIEWLMVTRSDPGGNVPRFLIDRGTPPGIVGDAGKFLNWAASTVGQDCAATPIPEGYVSRGRYDPDRPLVDAGLQTRSETSAAPSATRVVEGEANASSNEFYGFISGAIGVVTSMAYGLRQQFSTPLAISSGSGSSSPKNLTQGRPTAERAGDEDGSASDGTSEGSFASAVEKSTDVDKHGSIGTESNSDGSRAGPAGQGLEKELRKLDDQCRKLDQGFAKMQERLETKQRDEVHKDAAAQAKARDKHDKELAKRRAKYQRDMDRLIERRAQHEQKAELRRRKMTDKEDRTRLTLELDRVKAERDAVTKRAELLQRQVGELQAQNTMLVAKLGRLDGGSGQKSVAASLSSSKTSP